jgi:UDP-N-acetylglucosamine 2-epimerase (non-hydrolysing)
MSLRILAIVGTRPEAIKMAPVILRMGSEPDHFEVRVCAAAQHREMLDQALNLFGIAPDLDLGLMQPNQTPSQVAARVLLGLEHDLAVHHPDWVLVQGDTTTVMASALCAHHNRVRVGHVEAGLRSFDRANPFPEEMNRVVADHVSDLHFAPTPGARDNLLREGLAPESILVTGNTVVDALLTIAARSWQPPTGDPLAGIVGVTGLTAGEKDSGRYKRIILATAHRRESWGAPLRSICAALRALSARGDVQVVFPVHRNPKVWDPVHHELEGAPGILLLPPLDYQQMVYLMKLSYLLLTDSGGLQEEAPCLGLPVLVLRDVTERPEGVEAGVARLVGTDCRRIVAEASRLLDDPAAHREMARTTNPYGDGHAAARICQALWQYTASRVRSRGVGESGDRLT